MLESTEPALHEFGGAHHACPDKARAVRELTCGLLGCHLSLRRGARHALCVQGTALVSIASEQLTQHLTAKKKKSHAEHLRPHSALLTRQRRIARRAPRRAALL